MNNIERIEEKINQAREKVDNTTPGSSEYHLACAEYCLLVSENANNEIDKTGYAERAGFHKLIGTVLSEKKHK